MRGGPFAAGFCGVGTPACRPLAVARPLQGGGRAGVHVRFALEGRVSAPRGPDRRVRAWPRGIEPRPPRPGAGPARHVTAAASASAPPGGRRPGPRPGPRALLEPPGRQRVLHPRRPSPAAPRPPAPGSPAAGAASRWTKTAAARAAAVSVGGVAGRAGGLGRGARARGAGARVGGPGAPEKTGSGQLRCRLATAETRGAPGPRPGSEGPGEGRAGLLPSRRRSSGVSGQVRGSLSWGGAPRGRPSPPLVTKRVHALQSPTAGGPSAPFSGGGKWGSPWQMGGESLELGTLGVQQGRVRGEGWRSCQFPWRWVRSGRWGLSNEEGAAGAHAF